MPCAHVCVIAQLLSPLLRRAARSRRGEGDVNGARCSALSSSRRSLYRRADGIKRSHSTRIQWALRALSSRILLVFSFFPPLFFPFFFSFCFSDRPPLPSFSRSRRFAEARLHKEYNVVDLMSLAIVDGLGKRRISWRSTFLFKVGSAEGEKNEIKLKSEENRSCAYSAYSFVSLSYS